MALATPEWCAGRRSGLLAEDLARDLLRPLPAGVFGGTRLHPDGHSLWLASVARGVGGNRVQHGGDRLGQRGLAAAGLLVRAVGGGLVGIDVEDLAPGAAKRQHPGGIIVGGGVRRAPDAPELAEAVAAEDVLDGGGDRLGLLLEDSGVDSRQEQPGGVSGVPGGHRRVANVGEDQGTGGGPQPVPIAGAPGEVSGLDP